MVKTSATRSGSLSSMARSLSSSRVTVWVPSLMEKLVLMPMARRKAPSSPAGEKTLRILSYRVDRVRSPNRMPCLAFSSYRSMALSDMPARSSSVRGS